MLLSCCLGLAVALSSRMGRDRSCGVESGVRLGSGPRVAALVLPVSSSVDVSPEEEQPRDLSASPRAY